MDNIPQSKITDFVEFDLAPAIKFTILRGSAGDPDIFGAQQYAPLLNIEVPVKAPN
jgi:hypothetical protein